MDTHMATRSKKLAASVSRKTNLLKPKDAETKRQIDNYFCQLTKSS
jgi:hypothetical protein